MSEVTIGFVDAVRGAERELSIQTPGEAAKTIKVRIPAGVRDGGKIRLRGQGAAGGDLVLRVHVREHPHFRREGDDLVLNVPVSVGEAFRGAKIEVPTPEGAVTMQLPKGVRSGAKLRLRGRGVRRGQGVGDLYAIVQIVLPPPPEGENTAVSEAVETIEKAYREPLRKDLSF